jgi:uncharacterized protein (DUF3084 family)
MTRIYAETVANGEAISGLRVDMVAMQTGVHGDMFALKGALDLQGDSLRKEIGVQAATLRADMTAFREAVSQRFERSGTQLRSLGRDMDERFGSVDESLAGMEQRFQAVDRRFDSVDQRFEAVDRRFDSVDQRFDSVDQRFDSVDQRFEAVDAKLDAILGELRRPG